MMWPSTNDDDVANRLSVLSTIDVASTADSATPTECKDAIIQSLQNQLLESESKYAALQRSIPRLAKLNDLSGKDVTEQMTELTRLLTDRDYQLENTNALCARKHEELELVRTELFRRLRAAEEQMAEATRRAKAYETENGVLREQIDNEQSRLFRIGHMGDHSGTDTETLVSHAVEHDILDKMHQDLNDRLVEVEAYRRDVVEWRHKYEAQSAELDQMKALNDKYRTFIDRILSGDELKKSFLEKSLAAGTTEDGVELDYAVANLLATLQLLDANGRQMTELRTEVMDALRRHGYAANEAVVEVLSQSLRHDISQRRYSNVDEQAMDAAVEDQLAHVSMNELAKNTTINMSVLNKTAAEVSQDMGAARRQMRSLHNVCMQLFEKLRGTAEFLEMLAETEDGSEIAKRIQKLRLDLDKSLHEAQIAANEFEKAEKSMIEYCEMMSQLVDTSMFNVSMAADDDNDFAINMHEVDQMHAEREQLKAELQQLEVEQTNAKSQLERVQSEVAAAIKKLDDLRSATALTSEEAEQQKAELQQLEVERTNAKSQLELVQSEVTAATKKLDDLRSATALTAAQSKQLEEERVDADRQLKQVKAELSNTVQMLTERTAAIKRLDNDSAKQTEMMQHLDRVIAEKTEETKRLECLIAEKNEAIRNLNSEQDKENASRLDKKEMSKQITGELYRIYDTLASAQAMTSSVFKTPKPSSSKKK